VTKPARSDTDWHAWHAVYDEPGSRFAARLAGVQGEVRSFLDHAPAGPVVALDMCGGESRTILGVLDGHPRAPDVTLQLVELDPHNVATARAEAARIGIAAFIVRDSDGGCSDTYEGLARADLLVMSGLLVHMSPRDRKRTVRHLSELCAPDARIVWTLRERRKAERFVGTLVRHGFAPVPRDPALRAHWVGAARMTCAPAPLQAGVRWFTFIPLRQTRANKARVQLGRWRRQLLRQPLDS